MKTCISPIVNQEMEEAKIPSGPLQIANSRTKARGQFMEHTELSVIGAAGREQANVVYLDFICTLSLWKHIWTHFPDPSQLETVSMAEWKCFLTSSYSLSPTDRNFFPGQ